MDSHSSINWARRFKEVISRDTNIPTDIIFQIIDGDDVTELEAHKMFLGMVSPVFLNMFYVVDTNDRTAKKIIVQQTSAPAFQIMLDAIYFVRSIKNSLRGKTVDEAFAVLDVVTRYQIPELVDQAGEHLASLPLSETTVLEVVADAVRYLPTFEATAHSLILHCVNFTESMHMVMMALDLVSNYQIPNLIGEILERLASFPLSNDNVMKVSCKALSFQTKCEDKSNDLLHNCAKFVMSRFTDFKSVFRFTADNEDQMAVVFKLQALMVNLPSECPNCLVKRCRNGLEVPRYNLRRGLVVMNKKTKLMTKVVDFENHHDKNFLDSVKLEINGGVVTFYNYNYPKLVFRCVR